MFCPRYNFKKHALYSYGKQLLQSNKLESVISSWLLHHACTEFRHFEHLCSPPTGIASEKHTVHALGKVVVTLDTFVLHPWDSSSKVDRTIASSGGVAISVRQ